MFHFLLYFLGGEKTFIYICIYLELLPFNWWTWESTLLKSTFCWSLNKVIKEREKPKIMEWRFRYSSKYEKSNQTQKRKNQKKETEKQKAESKTMDPYRALDRSLRSFSESSKKRDTTSTTKSGLLSSCSCWSCVNWPSKNPYFPEPKRPPPDKSKNQTHNQKENNKTNPYEIRSSIYFLQCLTSRNKDAAYSTNLLCIWTTSMFLPLSVPPLYTLHTQLYLVSYDPIKLWNFESPDLVELLHNQMI